METQIIYLVSELIEENYYLINYIQSNILIYQNIKQHNHYYTAFVLSALNLRIAFLTLIRYAEESIFFTLNESQSLSKTAWEASRDCSLSEPRALLFCSAHSTTCSDKI